jgi:hypothetical protein
MTRMSKQGERRNTSPRKHRNPSKKTGPLADNLPGGFKTHENSLDGELAKIAFVPKIR